MPVASAPQPTIESTNRVDGADTPPGPVTVHSCSRLGRTANPPRRLLRDLLRFGRRR